MASDAALSRRWLARCGASLLAMLGTGGACLAASSGLGGGTSSVQKLQIGGLLLSVATYTPAGCDPRATLIIFHGQGRDARRYRDYAVPLADETCSTVYAPEFDKMNFPKDLYQYGGVVSHPRGHRTVDLVEPLIAWTRAQARTRLPLILFGHSAGAQFLGRVAAFSPTSADLTVIANPSTWVFASLEAPMPDGFGRDMQAEADLRSYLATEILVVLGQNDVGTRNLAQDAGAKAQGRNRLERGRRAFDLARDRAEAAGLPFKWGLSVLAGVGHSAKDVLNSPAILNAINVLEHRG